MKGAAGDRARGRERECVWNYPRPPALEETDRHLRVELAGIALADTRSAYRVLETSHPPVYYMPPGDVAMEHLVETARTSWCEWKGRATYYTAVVGDVRLENVAWTYLDPTPAFEAIRGYVAFYPFPMDACTVDGEAVVAQPGDFYGGWITADIEGPFKGGPGTRGW